MARHGIQPTGARTVRGLALLGLALTGFQASAAEPGCSFDVDVAPFVDDAFSGSIAITNDGTATGFAPTADLFLPPEVTLDGASFFGTAVAFQTVGVGTGAPLVHPVSGQPVAVPTGYSFVVARFPLSSQASSAPSATLELDFSMAGGVVDSPLALYASCQYALGLDAVVNAGVDAPIHSDDPLVTGDELDAIVIPSIVRFTGAVTPVNEPAGPSFPVEWTLSVQVAAGETLVGDGGDITLSDALPAGFVVTGLTAPGANIVSPAALPSMPGEALDLRFASLTNTTDVIVTGYFDATVVGAAGAPVDVTTTASLTDLSYLSAPLTVADVTLDHSVHAVELHETITNASGPGFRPGDEVEVCVSPRVSDHFSAISALGALTSTIPDGMTFLVTSDPGFVTTIPNADGSTDVVFNVAPTLAGGTSSTHCLSATIDQSYANGDVILPGAILNPTHSFVTMVNGNALTVTEGGGDADAQLGIDAPTFTKTITAVNGVPVGVNPMVRPGDTVTFSLQGTYSTGDIQSIEFVDYLPQPVFDAEEHGDGAALLAILNGTTGGVIRYGAGHTASDATAVTTTSASTENTIGLSFGSADASPTASFMVDVEIDMTVSGNPVANGLVLTNDATSSSTGAGVIEGRAIAALTILEPELAIIKSNDSGALHDAGDPILYTITIPNTGGQTAFDVTVLDTVPAGLTVVGPAVVTSGHAAVGDLFGAGLQIDAIPVGDTVTITYAVTVDVDAGAGISLTNIAMIDAYASLDGGVDHVGTPLTASSEINLHPFQVAIVGDQTSGTIGDTVDFTVTYVIPEGVHPDIVLRADFGQPMDVSSVAIVDDLAIVRGTPTFATGGAFSTLNGTITNTDTDPTTDETITVTFTGTIANNAASQAGTTLVATGSVRQNSVTRVANTFDVAITEPVVTVSANPNGTVTMGGETVSLSVCVAHDASTPTAHDLTYSTSLPAGLQNLTGFTVDSGPTPTLAAVSATGVDLAWTSLAAGDTTCFSFDADVVTAAPIGGTLTVPSTVDWTSQAGTPPAVYERTGVDGAGGLNDYIAADNASVTISPVAITNTSTASGPLTIGSVAPFVATFDVPQGTLPGAVLTYTLPEELGLSTIDALLFDGALTCGGAGCAPVPTVSADGRTISFALADLVNVDVDSASTETIRLELTTIVRDIPASTAGDTLTTTASLGGAAVASAPVVSLVEPGLSVAATLGDTSGDAGDTSILSVRMEPTSADADVYEPTFTIGLPAGLDATGVTAGTCGPLVVQSVTDDLVFVVAADRSAAEGPCTFEVAVTVDSDVVSGSSLEASVATTFTSQPGVVSFPAVPNGSERSYSVAPQSDAFAVDGVSLAMVEGPSTDGFSAGGELLFGEQGSYVLTMVVPEGSNPVEASFVAMPGMVVDAVTVDTSAFAGTVPTTVFPVPVGATSVDLDFGMVANPGDNDLTNNTVTVTVDVSASNGSNPVLGQVSSSAMAGGSSAMQTLDLEFLVGQPVIDLTVVNDTAAGAEPAAGDAMAVTATLSNGGTGLVCDTTVFAQAPAGFTFTDPSTDGVDNDGNGGIDDATELTWTLTNGELAVDLVGCLLPSDALVLDLVATADSDIGTTEGDFTFRLPDYRSLAVNGDLAATDGDQIDTNQDGTVDEVDDGVATVTVDPVAPDLAITLVTTTTGPVAPGDPVSWRLEMANTGDGDLTDLTLSDVFPTEMSLILGSSMLVDAVGGTVDEQATSIGISGFTVAAGTTAVLTFDTRVDANLTGIVQLSNQATATSTSGYPGPYLSDDPAVAGAADPTVFALDTPDDVDGDGLSAAEEAAAGTSDTDADSDDDGLSDFDEVNGPTSPILADSDSDGVQDGTESGLTVGLTDTDLSVFRPDLDPSSTTDPMDDDSDDDGLLDGEEDVNGDGAVTDLVLGDTGTDGAGETDPSLLDTDGDGLSDGEELTVYGTSPVDVDSDDDGLSDGAEVNTHGTDPLETDSDADGLSDGDEVNTHLTEPLDRDSDDDGLFDGVEVNTTSTDPNDADSDDDSLSDAAEVNTYGTNPNDEDTDGDTLTDAGELFVHQSDPTREDTDGDGLSDPTEVDETLTDLNVADSDRDGLSDFREDTLGTDPNDRDSDSGGVTDGVEDELDDTNPLDGDDDSLDSADADLDGLTNDEELALGSDPFRVDSDGDGLSDGDEVTVHGTDPRTPDSDGDGLPDGDEVDTHATDPLDADSDDDGLSDGQEVLVFSTDPQDTDTDDDGLSDADELHTFLTDPSVADTDLDGLSDGDEVTIHGSLPTVPDTDGDSVSDGDEITAGTNPNDGFVDVLGALDTDGDGLSDAQENALGTDVDGEDTDGDGATDAAEVAAGSDPTLADTDGDGLNDGDELNVHQTSPTAPDTDGDGLFDSDELNDTGTDPLVADTDEDGLTDGEEQLVFGTAPLDSDTDDDLLLDGEEVNLWHTSPTNADTDDGSVTDGAEVAAGDDPLNTFDDDPTRDSDGDGLTDAEEIRRGTNPQFDDTDADGLSDGDEVLVYETDPLVADTDGGGESDAAEVRDGTDPNDPNDDGSLFDTDGDGLTDIEEANLGTDPLDRDSDDDGLTDGEEVDTYGTDPLLEDSDGGGVPDGTEVALLLDPTDPSDDTAGSYRGGDVIGCTTSGSSAPSLTAFGLLALAGLLRRRERN